MRKLFYLSVILVLLSCNQEKKKTVQGELEDFVSDSFVLHRDEKIGYLNIRGVVKQGEQQLIYSYWNNTFLFFDPKTGLKTHSIEIPKEGPLSVRGGSPQNVQFFDDNFFLLLGRLGDVVFQEDNQIVLSFQLDMDTLGINLQNTMSSRKQKITRVSPTVYEISNDPFDLMSFSDRTNGFDMEKFGAWVAQFDDQGNWICISDFKGPFDKSYGETLEVGDLMRITENGISWSLFPFSDSLYQTENCKVTRVLNLESSTPIRYHPSKEVNNGSSRTWIRPDDAGMNLSLLHDPKSGIIVRMTLLEQKKAETENTDPRESLYSDENRYLLLLYNNDWELIGELKMVYPAGTRFENLFVSNGSLFINKPDQKSEDEYEFYKIDLAQFGDK